MKNLLLLFLALFFAFGCQQNDASAESDAMKISAVSMEAKAGKEMYYAASVDSVAVEMNLAMPSKPNDETMTPKIIKNGNLRFETDDLEKTYSEIQSLIKKYNATVQSDSEGKSDGSMYKDLTIRVPSQNFDVFIQNLSTGIPYFDTKEISSEDVTEEYIDVASRINTKKVLEARYLELLKKANKVSEMMEVEKQLSEIREEIEAKEGRLKYLKNRVAMSTINVSFYKTISHKSGATVSYGAKIWNAIKSGFNGISSFFIWLLEVWPFILILVALIYLIRKRFKKKIKKEND